jgi:hypothetical protein
VGEDVTLVPLACTATTITVKADSSVDPSVAVTYTLRVGTTITAIDVGVASSDLVNTALSCQMSGSNVCSASASVPVSANALVDVSANVQLAGEGTTSISLCLKAGFTPRAVQEANEILTYRRDKRAS